MVRNYLGRVYLRKYQEVGEILDVGLNDCRIQGEMMKICLFEVF